MVILDGLDALSGNHTNFSWIPKELPPNVNFIVSVPSGSESDCTSFKQLQVIHFLFAFLGLGLEMDNLHNKKNSFSTQFLS